jgi:beta-lactamase regulating signal transducer with metallopeptidase domain
MNINIFFIASIMINSALAFMTAALFVELFLRFFLIKRYRLRSFLRCIPFFSLILDRILNQFNSVYTWLNPLSCDSCIQNLILNLFPSLNHTLISENLTLVNYLHEKFPPIYSHLITITFFSTTIILFLRKIIFTHFLNCNFNCIIQKGVRSNYELNNKKLKIQLENLMVTIILSDQFPTPIATYNNIIVIPTEIIKKIPEDEYEAILAHELEHIRWKDPLFRSINQLVAAFFWWVPTKSWFKKMILEQEMACDQSILNYELKADSLASALIKFSRISKSKNYDACMLVDNDPIIRLKTILGLKANQKSYMKLILAGVGMGSALLGICTLWS